MNWNPSLTDSAANDSFTSVDKLHSLYGDLLKRLDDSSDDVRIAMTRTLSTYARYVSTNQEKWSISH